MTTVAVCVMDQLKAATAELHTKAEQSALQQRMVRGTVSRAEYAGYLRQLFELHSAIEARLAHVARSDARVAELITKQHTHSARLARDLAALGTGPDAIEVVASTRRLADQITSPGVLPAAVLGHFYVLEGSMNGNKFIARALSRGLGLSTENGLSYLDSYGDNQREVWQRFKDAMNAATFSLAEIDAMLQSARDMFQGIAAISGEVAATQR